MSHEFIPSLTQGSTACPPDFQVPLVPGLQYEYLGHSQGSLLFDIYAVALTVQDLSTDVHVLLLQSEAAPIPMFGLFDWENCQLTYLADLLGNSVWGAPALEQFHWGENSVYNNQVLSGGLMVLHGNVDVHDNTVGSGSTLDSTAMDESAVLTFTDNDLSGQSSITLDGSGDVGINHTALSEFSSITVAVTNTQAVIVQEADLTGGAQINISSITDPTSVIRTQVENGTLVPSAFVISESRLEAANSTLVANVTLAIKSGYVNVLP
jgi:hypothetical protein